MSINQLLGVHCKFEVNTMSTIDVESMQIVKYCSNKYELGVICPLKVIRQYRIQHLILVLILLPDKPISAVNILTWLIVSFLFFFVFSV